MRFGFRLRSVRLSSVGRYDRLLAIAAIAVLFLVLIGSEVVRRHLDCGFRPNTSTSRTHSGLLSCFDPVLERMG
jgi:hypothetical protein